jgi:nucleoside-diphosphate-sugar epimerase/choline dehydrogenase-like flavoprotein
VPDSASGRLATEILVIGSGAGGAATAATLAEGGCEVLLVEEGPNADTGTLVTNSPEALPLLYRNGGMTPVLGRQAIAFVEGRCVGGSTEVNSGLWHRLPADAYARWHASVQLEHFSPRILEPYFERLEAELSVSTMPPERVPKSAVRFREGVERMGWSWVEVPRCQRDAGSPFAPGAKQSMQRTYLPRALRAGAKLLSDCKVTRLHHDGVRVRGADVVQSGADARERHRFQVTADAVVVCGGAIQTPALLRRSGIKRNVGDSLSLHPMLKAAALFPEEIRAHEGALPMYQVKEFAPTITIGGGVFTPGFLAMILSDHWSAHRAAMEHWTRMAAYYTATRSMGRGSVRVIPGLEDGVVVRYALSKADERNLSIGLARLGEILFAAGAEAVYPSLAGQPALRSAAQCRGFLEQPIPAAAMSLSCVHAFGTCPMGENPDVCATDSFGRVHGFRNLSVADASLIPDAPGVNPQGATMAIALRNAEHLMEERQRTAARRPGASARRPDVLLTGAPGWLGTRLAESLLGGVPAARAAVPPGRVLRCLVRPSEDAGVLSALSPDVELAPGDLTDPESLRAFCRGAEGATLFHVAGLVHPARFVREFERVNVEGTRSLLAAAQEAGVRRVVVVSSNSPIGCNPSPDHVFDESSPVNPYMGYGRSKARMEAIVRDVHASGRLETVIVRPPWFYGPRQPARQTQFFTMIKNGRFPILGDGRQRRSMAYVDNICQGLLLAAASERANGQTYWIADERPYTIEQIVTTVAEVLESFGFACRPARLRLPRAVGELARWMDAGIQRTGLYQQQLHVLGEMHQTIACSIAKAQRELGYAPAVALREGMAASVEWCLANGQRI